jgi:hypothetical protein
MPQPNSITIHLVNKILQIPLLLKHTILLSNVAFLGFETDIRRLGGVVVSVLATGHKGCGFKTRLRRWIFKGDKNPQHTFLSDGK